MTADAGDARRRAREAALQMLYQWEVGRVSPGDAILSYWAAHSEAVDVPEAQREFAERLVRGTTGRLEEIDALLGQGARNWRVERMAVLDRLVLRLATGELLTEPTPAAVVINEALELARAYCGEESVAFVNGVLDAVRRTLARS